MSEIQWKSRLLWEGWIYMAKVYCFRTAIVQPPPIGCLPGTFPLTFNPIVLWSSTYFIIDNICLWRKKLFKKNSTTIMSLLVFLSNDKNWIIIIVPLFQGTSMFSLAIGNQRLMNIWMNCIIYVFALNTRLKQKHKVFGWN